MWLILDRFENILKMPNFVTMATSEKILAKFEILPICLKLVGNLDLVSSYRSGIITSGFGSKKYPFAEFLAFSCHFTMNKLTHEFQATPQFNTLPIGQSSYNFTGLLLPSVPNKCHPYWTDSRIFWKCQILSPCNKWQNIGKIWNFTDLSETRWKPRSCVILSIWYHNKRFWFEKVPICRVSGIFVPLYHE